MWFLQQIDPQSTIYNIGFTLLIEPPADIDALHKTCQHMVDQHEALRSNFFLLDLEPVQLVHNAQVVDFEIISAVNWSSADLKRAVSKTRQQPFDLSKDNVMRVRLYTLDNGRRALQFVVHHIAIDGWSVWLLLDDLRRQFELNQAHENPAETPPPARVQYDDFVTWQTELLAGERGEEMRIFWADQLAGELPRLALPADNLQAGSQTFSQSYLQFQIDPELTQSLRQLSLEEGGTLYSILLTAFQVFLYKYSGQQDIVIGTPVHGRSKFSFAKTVGNFVNAIAMRDQVDPSDSLRSHLRKTNRTVNQALLNQYFPVAILPDLLRKEGELAGQSLFQVGFNLLRPPRRYSELAAFAFEDVHSQHLEFGAMTLSSLDIDLGYGIGHVDLYLELADVKDHLTGRLNYNAALFGEETISSMLDHFMQLLGTMVAYPDDDIADLNLLLPEEQEKLLVSWNDTASQLPPEQHIHKLIEEQAAHTPEATAVVGIDRQLTYAELNERANQVAHYLRGLGIGPDEVVGIAIDRSPELIVAILGILKAGGAYLPLDPAYPSARLAFMLADVSPQVLLTEESHLPQLPVDQLADATIVCLDRDRRMIARESIQNPQNLLDPQHLAYIIYTSGSTGEPKGVMITHLAVLNHNLSVIDQFLLTPKDRVLQFATINFDTAVEEIFPTLIQGATMILRGADIPSTNELCQLVAQAKITVLDLPTAYWAEWVSSLVSLGQHLPECLRLVIVGGEKAGGEKYRQWQHIAAGQDITWINSYGPTETTIISTLYKPDDQVGQKIPIGRPIANTSCYILDENQRPVPIGVPGELYIGGLGLARGYYNRPALTAERFIPDPFATQLTNDGSPRIYRTGDLVRYRPDGNIEFLGRVDHQVKIRGYRIEPGEIEAVLLRHAGIKQAVVAPRTDRSGNKRLVAYLVSQEDLLTTSEELRQFLKQQLPDYMIPTAFVPRCEIPLTSSGKIDRGALPDLGDQRPDLAQPVVPPRTSQERMLADIWAQVLQVDLVGVYDNFFDSGGHSLLATQVVSRIVNETGITLSLRTLFEAPTVADLSMALDEARRAVHVGLPPPIQPVSRDAPIPLSFAQERMWFLHQLTPSGHAYNIPITVQYQQALNRDALQKTVDALVARHESLRTIFPEEDGIPQQEILPSYSIAVNEIDLSSFPLAEQKELVLQLVQAEVTVPFDLAAEPPWRFTLFYLEDELLILHFTFHHTIFDQWSTAVFLQDFNTLYQATIHGEIPDLLPLEVQYADFTMWQRDWLQGPVLDELLNYWRNQLAGLVPLSLPTDHPRPPLQTLEGATEFLALSPALVDELLAFSRRSHLSPFMLTLAVFKLLLGRYTSQTDIAVGVPVANRHYLAIEPVIGVFVNTLAVRSDLAGDPTFAQILEVVRDNLLDAYAHQDLPFEKLVNEIVETRDLSHTPLVQVMFNMANAPFDHESATVSPIAFVEFDRGAAQFDLSMTVVLDEQLPIDPQVALEYNTAIYERETMQRFLAHYEALLTAVLQDAHLPISSYEILPSAEQQLIISDWNQTESTYPQSCLHELFVEQVRRTPTKTAVVFDDQSLTYSELDQRSNQLAHYLQSLDIGPESIVGVYVERSLEMIIGLLGILKTGAAYLPLDPGFPASRLAYMVEDAQVTVVLTQAAHMVESTVFDIAQPVNLDAAQSEFSQLPTSPLSTTTNLDDRAYVIYTSGSTGKPKGVQITHRNAVNFLASMQKEPGLAADDIMLAVTTLSFDISVLELFLPLINGAEVFLTDRGTSVDGKRLANLIQDSGATVMQATPATWNMLLASGWRGCPTLKALCGGEALPRELAELLLPKVAELWNMYGPTETTVWSTIYPVTAVTDLIPIGRPIDNTQIYLLDQHMRPVPLGVPGELFIGGHGVSPGYLNRPGLTAERFLRDPFSSNPNARLYKTGDDAYYLPNGSLVFSGRLDHQVKIRGFRIELGEIETELDQYSAVAQSVAVIQEDDEGDKRIIAFYIPTNEESPSDNELRNHLQKTLPAYMVPSRFMALDALPLTPNRKVDRGALPELEQVRPHLETSYVPPTSETEIALAEIWCDLLKVDQVGAGDNFFELGGHSLLAVRLFSRIEEIFGETLPLTSLFEDATIQSLARRIDEQTETDGWSSLVPLQPNEKEKNPIFFGIHGLTGDVYWFESLARYMGPEQPFYGLQSQGLDGIQEPLSTFEAMAAHYIDEIRDLQPDGPYYIGGYSLGANVAYEMAQQLEQQGQEIALLALIDHMPANSDYFDFRWNLGFIRNLLRNLPYRLQAFLQLSPGEIAARFQKKMLGVRMRIQRRQQGKAEEGQIQPEIGELVDNPELFPTHTHRVIENNHQAWRAYHPRRYSGHVTLLRAQGGRLFCSPDPEMGWGRFAEAGVTVYEIPGSHLYIFKEPYVQELARTLRLSIDLAQEEYEQQRAASLSK